MSNKAGYMADTISSKNKRKHQIRIIVGKDKLIENQFYKTKHPFTRWYKDGTGKITTTNDYYFDSFERWDPHGNVKVIPWPGKK